MGLQSLVESWRDANGEVSGVSGVQASTHTVLRDTSYAKAEVSGVSARIHDARLDTSDTCLKQPGYQRKPAPVLGCTPDTSDTWRCERYQPPDSFAVRTDSITHGLVNLGKPMVTPPGVPDSDGWPRVSAMNGGEIDAYTRRLASFISWGLGPANAETLARTLSQRDLDHDERRLCLECAHLSRAGQCRNWRGAGFKVAAPIGLVQVLQRCPGFKA
jgi:hypothetical protein